MELAARSIPSNVAVIFPRLINKVNNTKIVIKPPVKNWWDRFFNWEYHVAVSLRIADGNSAAQRYVFDPTFSTDVRVCSNVADVSESGSLMPLATWLSHMGLDSQSCGLSEDKLVRFAPGSAFSASAIQQSRKEEPVTTFDELPPFKMSSMLLACNTLYKDLGKEEGWGTFWRGERDPAVNEKRERLVQRNEELINTLRKLNKVEENVLYSRDTCISGKVFLSQPRADQDVAAP